MLAGEAQSGVPERTTTALRLAHNLEMQHHAPLWCVVRKKLRIEDAHCIASYNCKHFFYSHQELRSRILIVSQKNGQFRGGKVDKLDGECKTG